MNENTLQPKKKSNWKRNLLLGVAALWVIIMLVPSDKAPKEPSNGDAAQSSVNSSLTETGAAAELLLDITSGMTPAQVQSKAGAPHEVRNLAGNSGQIWIYGPDSNQYVQFMDEKVVMVVPSITWSREQLAKTINSAPGDPRLFKVTEGMTPAMVLRTMGKPQEVRDEYGVSEMWIYGPGGNQYVQFMDGVVVQVVYDIRQTNKMMNSYAQ